jgi:TolA-binding protein
LRERLGRTISVLAGYAMRPQLAMAALLLLMIGSSFLFLRAKPTDADSVRVTERGIRETDESVAIVPLPEEPDELPPKSPVPRTGTEAKKVVATAATESPARSASLGNEQPSNLLDAGAEEESASAAYDGAMSSYRRGDYRTAQVEFEAIAAEAGEHAPSAELFAAHSVRGNTGCADAAPKFDAVQRKFPGTNVGQEAAWQAATCYRSLGHLQLARQHYQRLLEAPAYADRAQHALLRLDRQPGEVVATRKATAAEAPASALPKVTKAGSKAGSSADSTAGVKPDSGPSLSPK